MTPADAMRWLDEREPELPPDLRARMEAALDATAASSVPDRFGEAALECLRAAVVAGADRTGALHLLAADGLLTHGAEAAAEDGPGALREWASRFGADRMADLLAEANR